MYQPTPNKMIVAITSRYGSKKGDPEFHTNYDIDGDWDIDYLMLSSQQ